MPIRPALAAVALVLLLAGCVPGPQATPPPTEVAKPEPTAPPAPTSTATPKPTAETEPAGLACADLLSPQAVYDYNPNVGLLTDFTPSADSLAGEAVAQQGIACRLLNQTSGSTVDIGVVRFTEAAFPGKRDSLSAGASPTAAFDGFFDATGDGGVAQVFVSPYWLTITSGDFVEAGDAAQLVETVVSGL